MISKQAQSKFIFETTNILKVQDFLEENPDLNPREFQDRKSNNILHHLSFNDQKQLLKLYILHTARLIQRKSELNKSLYKKQPKHEIAVWINEKNQQGFTPLLYAAFNGHIELIHYLLDLGANASFSNNTQLNVLHMAAQNNKVSTLIYFQGKMDYNVTDSKGSTALHWAAYSGSQEAAAFLLTIQNIKINVRDNQGQTPLFLATMYGNTKIVRRLLIKNAKREIKNQKGELPIDIARQSQFKNIIKMLDDDYSCLDFIKFYYNVKLEYKAKSRSLATPTAFLLTTVCTLTILHGLLIYPHTYMYIIQACIMLTMLLLYLSLLVGPKKVQKQNISLYINETKKLCFECSHKKPKRSYHCDICKICVEQYDHHCTWINNCVGKRNICRFIVFVLFLVFSLGIVGVTAAWGFLKIGFFQHLTDQWITFRDPFQQDQLFEKWGRFALFTLNLLVSTFALPVLLLLFVQIKNLLINKTTYQRIRGQNSSVRDQLKKKKKRGPSLANCKAMCAKTRQSFSSDQSIEDRLIEES